MSGRVKQEKKEMAQKFWIILFNDGSFRQHPSLEEAKKEAEEEILNSPNDIFYILEATHKIESEKPKAVITELWD